MWPPQWSPECSAGGDGQCDGADNGHGDPCLCPCHTDPGLPLTVPLVRDWHDELHRFTRQEV